MLPAYLGLAMDVHVPGRKCWTVSRMLARRGEERVVVGGGINSSDGIPSWLVELLHHFPFREPEHPPENALMVTSIVWRIPLKKLGLLIIQLSVLIWMKLASQKLTPEVKSKRIKAPEDKVDASSVFTDPPANVYGRDKASKCKYTCMCIHFSNI